MVEHTSIIHKWTLCSLVKAYLDLTLSYFFLHASTFIFFATTFLSIFGLNFPFGLRPCDEDSCVVAGELIHDKNDKQSSSEMIIDKLRKALEEEQDACAALYVELEKDRSAAEIAADEAMSMILKLQEEKAELEMETRQYQRIVEEKNAYIEQEMEMLKEIIVKREKEKLVLEKELEVYKKLFMVSDIDYGLKSSSFDMNPVAKMIVDDGEDVKKKVEYFTDVHDVHVIAEEMKSGWN